jgi:prepilin-type N-terminal cleavage/methylation domain-containing protein
MMARSHKRKILKPCEKGFTIIEVIGVIVIIGIVAAMVVPSFNSNSIDVATAASTVQSDIQFAQELSLSRNPASAGAITLSFTSGSSSYTITDPSGAFTQTRSLPSTVTFTASGSISFNKYGEPEIAGSTQTFTINAGGKTQTLTVERYTGQVTIS